ncbi:microtubule-associated tyrosine carboxypeptidase isoform X2 [Lampris incognitus]|uniref:microtubule-associated tyrosine carboxypeptidase isoform X2 n=1 Tax=Lampris incognitus TaxID=2546036 RepID=UPI0024B4A588|nr:microtubule-associated tyrosine carboxypeptidase isoform X2 [Lampris incognitus]
MVLDPGGGCMDRIGRNSGGDLLETEDGARPPSASAAKKPQAAPANFSPSSNPQATPTNFSPSSNAQATPTNFSPSSNPQATPANFSPSSNAQATPANFTPSSNPQATPTNFTPSSNPQATPSNFSPSSNAQATPANFTPSSNPQATPTNFTPSSNPQATPSNFSPSSNPQATPTNFTPASNPQATPANFTPSSNPQATPANSSPASNPQATPTNSSPASAPQTTPIKSSPTATPRTTPIKSSPPSTPRATLINASPSKPRAIATNSKPASKLQATPTNNSGPVTKKHVTPTTNSSPASKLQAKVPGVQTQTGQVSHNGPAFHPEPSGCRAAPAVERRSLKGGTNPRPLLRRPLSLEITPQRQLADGRVLQPPWRSGAAAPSPPARSLTSPSLGSGGWMRRSGSTCSVNFPLRAKGQIRPATSLPHIARAAGNPSLPSSPRPCLLVALRPLNLEQEKEAFFRADYKYEPQFEYAQPEPSAVLEKYKEGSALFLDQAVGIMECVLSRFGSYENFEEVTGGSVLPKSRVWAAVRKYLQKEGCVGEVVVCLSEELLSQAVMMVESCRPTLTINLAGARQHWLEGMLRHEIGTHYLRGVNNSLQPWATATGRKQFGLKPANPTEEGLASLHSVLLRKQPYLWRAALLYYTVYHAASMSFSKLFSHIGRFVHDPAVRWEYCLRAKRGQTDTSKPGCFSKDQVYLDGILRILRHRRTIDFKMLTSLGKVSYEDVERLRHAAVLRRARIPHFMQDQERYLQHLDHIVTINQLDDAELQHLLP